MKNWQELNLNNPEKNRSREFIKFFGCLILALVIIFITLFAAVRLAVSPVVEKVNQLPGDFPEELAIYLPEKAEIELQTPEGKEKLLKIMGLLPNWLLKPTLAYLSNDLKAKLSQSFADKIDLSRGFTPEELKKALSSPELKKMETTSLSWKQISQPKEEVAGYYKNKLKESGFEFKENLADYEINLGFWKGDIFGLMSFKDDKENQSQAKIIVNYLKK
ncbi:MAG: hypothetical protein WC518_02035 [Patescibacteria group bacterium]